MRSDEFTETSVPLERATKALRLESGEELRARRVRGSWRAYWTLYVSGYSPGRHGGATLHLRWRAVRDDEDQFVTADTTEALEDRLEALHRESALDIPDFGTD